MNANRRWKVSQALVPFAVNRAVITGKPNTGEVNQDESALETCHLLSKIHSATLDWICRARFLAAEREPGGIREEDTIQPTFHDD